MGCRHSRNKREDDTSHDDSDRNNRAPRTANGAAGNARPVLTQYGSTDQAAATGLENQGYDVELMLAELVAAESDHNAPWRAALGKKCSDPAVPSPSPSQDPAVTTSTTQPDATANAVLDVPPNVGQCADSLVHRAVDEGMCAALLSARVEAVLCDRLAAHAAEASGAALAARVASPTTRAELLRVVEGRPSNDTLHADHLDRLADLEHRHAALRHEHDALLDRVEELELEHDRDRDGPREGGEDDAAAAAYARLAADLAEAHAIQRQQSAKLVVAAKINASLESQVSELRRAMQALSDRVTSDMSARNAEAARHHRHTVGIQSLDASVRELEARLAAADDAAALRAKLAERKTQRQQQMAEPATAGPGGWSSVKEKLVERRRAKEADEKAAASKMTRRRSAVQLLVPNPEWDVELLQTHPMDAFAKFLQTNRLRVVDLFNAMDRDKDTLLSYDEIFKGLQDLQIPLADTSVTDLCRQLDLNNDGFVTYKELKRCEQSYVRHSRELRKSEIAKVKNHPSKLYSSATGRKTDGSD
eukprot:m.18076 g.18076  ORF g.18076 m.18076 type:complete len:534 (+) comp3563_c0_seq1:155-1756(+)